MSEAQSKDLVVIGGGPGGYAAALAASAAGLSVTLVEADAVGGTCLHRGCIPAKELLETAAVFQTTAHAERFGVEVGAPTLDFSRATERLAEVVNGLHGGLAKLLKHRGIEVLQGFGTLVAPGIVEVSTAQGPLVRTGSNVILATGSVPRDLDQLPLVDGVVVNSDGFFHLDHLPERAIVVGAGAIGCEFASLLADLGVEVVMVEAADRVLAACDPDVSRTVARSFAKRKISVVAGASVIASTVKGNVANLTLDGGRHLEAELVVVAVGRVPRLDGAIGTTLDLVRSSSGGVVVDASYATSIDRLFAIGDVVAGSPQLAHVAFAQALVVIGALTDRPLPPVNAHGVPWAIYCRPEVAYVGLTEPEATALGYDVVVKRDPIGANSRAVILDAAEGMVKVICKAGPGGDAGEVLGVHLVGPWATEQLSGANVAVNLGVEVGEIAHFLQPHPSLSEAYGETLLALAGRSIHVH